MSEDLKEFPLTIRFTKDQNDKLERSARTGLKKAEVVRRCVDLALSEDPILVSFKEPFLREIDKYAFEILVSRGEAIEMMVVAFMTLMKTPLWNIIRPIEDIVEALAREKDESKEGGGPSRAGA